MKKYLLFLVTGLSLIGTVACTNQKTTEKPKENQSTSTLSETKENEQKSSPSESSKSDTKDGEEKTSESSNQSIRTSEGSKSELGQARITLFQEGIDSSRLSDQEVLKLWEQAKADKTKFIKSVKEKLNQ
ncbi:hypothetical protein F4V47_05585 [Lactococcus garvieae subsp. garvieae]|uniref:hypothetical protein n=1 Tax=Lactococcus garvieae TaxID=1363 RepID=UPI0005A88A21|nr:hypothetical protein [Lactococcus garvieae]KAA8713177.1 hypothetical protein F4V47_05585 [Lactococcus garvieae subsp. garvieae]MDG6192325.1 hypothetical protein [Lactococcus garvieae]PCR99018.1 hypothetical protein RU85_GL001376 [Lactococcus garvieae]QPR48287.1 hypothetical protein I6G86_06815 [Lactococcus garvieae]